VHGHPRDSFAQLFERDPLRLRDMRYAFGDNGKQEDPLVQDFVVPQVVGKCVGHRVVPCREIDCGSLNAREGFRIEGGSDRAGDYPRWSAQG
jgi:hypothetical protein